MDIPFISDILEFLQSVWDWLYVGIYDFVKTAFVLLTKMAIHAYFTGVIFAADVGYDVFSSFMNDIGVSQAIQSSYSSLDGKARAALAFFGIPEALNVVFSAIGTRFAMRFIPFIGN